MSKFKVGDKVTLDTLYACTFSSISNGKVYTVRSIQGNAIEFGFGLCSEHYFRLVSEDLVQIDKPFGELDKNTKLELFEAWVDDLTIQARFGSGSWIDIKDPSWDLRTIYRLKPLKSPEEIEKESIIAEIELLKTRLEKLNVKTN